MIDAVDMTDGPLRVFVSHAGRDLAWAEWVAWQLTQAGHEVELASWAWASGDNFVLRTSQALGRADVTVALYSAAYFEVARFTVREWTSVLARRARLAPLRVEEVEPPAVLAPVVFRDLFGVDEARAVRELLASVSGPRGLPDARPEFPGTGIPAGGRPRLPGVLPPLWNVPGRLATFTGRDALLVELRRRLTVDGPAVAQALHGVGGVGKTALAIEYAHRFAGSYELVWWVDAERSESVGEQLAALAAAAGWVPADTHVPIALGAVRRRLARTPGWLVVFDNADGPVDLREWLPQGPGHVLVTSRDPVWAGVAMPVAVEIPSRSESVALLRAVAPAVPEADADLLAEVLGDLPLAVAQAAGVLAETGIRAGEYIAELNVRTAAVLREGVPAHYGRSLAAAVSVAVRRLAAEDPAAAQLLRVCAFLAPEPVPVEFVTASPDGVLPPPLASVAGSVFEVRRAMGRISRFGLGRVDGAGLVVHRLTQAVLRDDLGGAQREVAGQARAVVLAARPADPQDPEAWPHWARWLPHLLMFDPAPSADLDLRSAADHAARYLLARGEVTAGMALAEQLCRRAREIFDDDHAGTLTAAHTLARAYFDRGRYQEARRLHEDTWSRRRRVLGADHPDTLASAYDLAVGLAAVGELDKARELDEDTWSRRRRVLGDDHPDTLTTANNFAVGLADMGAYERARQLAEETLGRFRRVLGDDHPDTLSAAHSFAIRLAAVGELERARHLDEDTWARRRRILGDDHPDTLFSASKVAVRLADVGELERARELGEDTWARRRRVLGDDHPQTLRTVESLAVHLRALGRHEDAAALEASVSQVHDGGPEDA